MTISVPQTDPKAAYTGQRADVEAAIARVLDSGRYILGHEVASFESEFASYIGRKCCLGVASGTDALTGAVRALGLAADDFVITASHTSVATVAAIELAGAKPLLIDIGAASYSLDRRNSHGCWSIRRDGLPPSLWCICMVIRRRPRDCRTRAPAWCALIEDCAQSHGAAVGGQRLGTLGEMAAFSFYPTKNLGAIGDGGAILVDDPERYQRLKAYRQYGWKTRQISEFPGCAAGSTNCRRPYCAFGSHSWIRTIWQTADRRSVSARSRGPAAGRTARGTRGTACLSSICGAHAPA